MFRAFALLIVTALFFTGCEKPEVDSAGVHYLAALDALDAGNSELALTELDVSIELEPDAWAYFERARIHAKNESDDLAKRDIQAGLKLDPNNENLKWLKTELRKSKEKRFEHGDVPVSSRK